MLVALTGIAWIAQSSFVLAATGEPELALDGAIQGEGAAEEGGEVAVDGSEDGGKSEEAGEAADAPKLERAGSNPAAPMKMRFGLGALRTLSGLNAIAGRLYLTDRLSLGLFTGFAVFSHKEADDDGGFDRRRSVGVWGVGTQVFYWPVQGDRSQVVSADFGIGFRGLLYKGFNRANPEEDDGQPDTIEEPLEIDVEVPLTTQLFVGDRVAVAPEFGVVFRYIPGNREPDQDGNSDSNPGSGVGEALGTTNGPGWGVEMGSHLGLFVGLNVSYFFGEPKR